MRKQLEDVDSSLREICSQETPVSILLLDSTGIARGRFRDFSNEEIRIEILERPETVTFKSFVQAAFICVEGNHSFVFVTSVKEFFPDFRPEVLLVRPPRQMASERRSAHRVPVCGGGEPLARLWYERRQWDVKAVDLSVTGILVEFPAGEVPAELPVGVRVRVRLRFEVISVELPAEIRRTDGNRMGLFFFEVWDGKRLDPPNELAKLVRRLEAIWLQRRTEKQVERERTN